MAPGLLIVWTDVAPDAEADFNAWYDHQHLEERVGVPGFLNGRRYRAVEGAPKYLAWYETESPAVLGSPAYGARQADPTAWTSRIMPSFRNVTRVTAARLSKAGGGLGGWCETLRFRPDPGAEAALAGWLKDIAPSLVGPGKAVAAQTWRPSDADAARGTAEAELRKTEERPPAWGLLIEAGDAGAAAAPAHQLAAALKARGAGAVELGLYRLALARGTI